MDEVEILLAHDAGAVVPSYAHAGDAGADLHATETVELLPGARALIGTGLRIALPAGNVAYVMPRSGLAIKHGVTVVNAPGVVDAGYRGEVRVALVNLGHEAYTVSAGDRIAQLVVQRVARASFVEVAELPGSQRGEGGFGSSGYGLAAKGVQS